MKGTKIAIFSAFFLSVLALAGSAYLYLQWQFEQSVRVDLESQLVQLEERATSQEAEIAEYKDEIREIGQQLKERSAEVETLEGDLEELRKEKSGLEAELDELGAENESLKKARAAPPEAVEMPVAEGEDVVAVNLTVPAPAGPATVTPAAAPKPTAPEERPKQVLSINRKFNFAVVNLGSRDHVKVGDALLVEREGKQIARLQVDKLYDNFSACTVLEEVKPASLREGDLVRLA